VATLVSKLLYPRVISLLQITMTHFNISTAYFHTGRYATLHHCHKSLDEGQSVPVLYADYAKAFDHVDHKVLLQKLKAHGVLSFIVR